MQDTSDVRFRKSATPSPPEKRAAREVVESYRRKFGASFEDACREWAGCAEQIEKLRKTDPDILFVDHRELESEPDRMAGVIARHVGRREAAGALGTFLRENRVAATESSCGGPVVWSADERKIYDKHCAYWES